MPKIIEPVLPLPTRLPNRDDLAKAVDIAKSLIFPQDPYEAAGKMVEKARAGDYLGAAEEGMGALPQQGMFAGRNAKTADLSKLATAERMAGEGAERRAIWDATGWFQGADGKWRFEIPDHEAGLKGYIVPGAAYEGNLGGILNHPKAFDSYVDLPEIVADFRTAKGSTKGTYSPGDLGEEYISVGGSTPLSTALHETQHAIQSREGFANGANGVALKPNTPAWDIYQGILTRMQTPLSHEVYSASAGYDGLAPIKDYDLYRKMVKSDAKKWDTEAQKTAVREAYHRAAGEVEARNVQSRMAMTPEERAARPPWETQDVPDDQQIVRFRASGGHVPVKLPLTSDDPNEVMRKAITYAFAVARMYGKADGGEVSAPITGQHTISLDDLIGRAPSPASSLGAYTDAGGQKIASPFVTSMANGYPVHAEPAKADATDPMSRFDKIFGRRGYDEGGPVDQPGDSAHRFVQDMLYGDILRPSPLVEQYAGKTANAALAANADRPMPTAHDFVQHQLNKGEPQLPQFDRAARDTMRDYAIDALHGAAYFTPAAPAVAAYDAYKGLQSGDPVEMGLAAAGLPGRSAKAAMLAAGVMMPTDAEAGPVARALKFVRTGAGLMEKDAALRELALNLQTKSGNPYKHKPFEEFLVKGEKVADYLSPFQPRTIEDLQGHYVAPLLSDLSSAGEKITQIGPNKLSRPFVTHGGGDYTRGPSSRGETPQAWASTPKAADVYQKKLAEAVPEGERVFGLHSIMGHTGADSSDMMVKAILRQLPAAKLTDDSIDLFNNAIARRLPDWPGLKARGLENYLMKLPFTEREALAKEMDKATFANLGFPSIPETRFAMTEPRLLSAPHLSTGYSIAELHPRSGVMTEVEHPHPNYAGGMPAPGEDAYFGGFTSPVHASTVWKKWWENLDPGAREYKNRPWAQRGLLTQFPVEKVDQEMVDRVMAEQEAHKRVFGWRKGGGVIPRRRKDKRAA